MNDKLAQFAERHVGGEPNFAEIPAEYQKEHHDTIVMKSLNWYSSNQDLSDSSKYFITYCTKNNLEIRKNIPDSLVGNTGFLCRMIHRGLIPTEKLTNRIKSRYDELSRYTPSKAVIETPVEVKASTQSTHVYSDMFIMTLTEIDKDIDAILQGGEVDKKINLAQVTQKDLKLIITYLKQVKTDYEGIDKLEPEYKACYPGKRMQNKVLAFIDTHIAKIEEYIKATKIVVSSKPVSAAKQVAGMRCMKEWDGFKSLPLEKIVGAKAILLFNTKYRKIMYLEAKSTFKCTGASFHEVDKWVCRTARKPETQLKDWMLLTKPQLKAALEAVAGANSNPTVRIGPDTLFLREWR